MSYQTMKTRGRNLRTYYYVKEANLKRLHMFQLYDILEKEKLWKQ